MHTHTWEYVTIPTLANSQTYPLTPSHIDSLNPPLHTRTLPAFLLLSIPNVQAMGSLLEEAWQAQGVVIQALSECKEPSQLEMMGPLQPFAQSVQVCGRALYKTRNSLSCTENRTWCRGRQRLIL